MVTDSQRKHSRGIQSRMRREARNPSSLPDPRPPAPQTATLDELLAELTEEHEGLSHVAFPDVIVAILTLEPRQAQAMCFTLWALHPDMVAWLAREGRAEELLEREGYGVRAAARTMKCAHKNVRDLVDRAKTNIAAALLYLPVYNS